MCVAAHCQNVHDIAVSNNASACEFYADMERLQKCSLYCVFPESTCVSAFGECNANPTCRLRMAEFMSACMWSKRTNRCDRNLCLSAIR